MSDYKNPHGLGAADVAHLRADDAFDGVFEEDSGNRYRVRGDLEPGIGQLLTIGPVIVRCYDGTPARWLAEVISPKPAAEPLPVGQVRRNPDGEIVAVRFDEFANPWNCSDGVCRWDVDVRSWPILVPETDLDALRTERDKLMARVDELQRKNARQRAELARLNPERDRLAALADTVETFVAEARRHLTQADAETRPALPEGYVAVEPWYLAEYLSEHVKWREWDEEDAVTVIQGAILLYARRAAEAGGTK